MDSSSSSSDSSAYLESLMRAGQQSMKNLTMRLAVRWALRVSLPGVMPHCPCRKPNRADS